MADIDITFGTNAGRVAGEVDRATASTVKAEGAASKLEGKSHSLGQTLRALGHSAGQTGGQIGKALGMGGGIGLAIIGLIALRKALELTDILMERQTARVKATAEAHLFLARSAKSAFSITQNLGLAAAKEQGAGIRRLTGRGGGALESANALIAKGVAPDEAFSAAEYAHKTFGGQAQAALDASFRANKAGGGSVTEGLKGLDQGELGNVPLAASRLLAQSTGSEGFSVGALRDAEKRQAASPLVSALDNIDAMAGQGKLHGQALIPQGQGAARDALNAEMSPLAKIMQDQYDQQIEQVTVLRAIAADQSWMRRQYEKLRHPFSNANIVAIDAANQVRANNGQPEP